MKNGGPFVNVSVCPQISSADPGLDCLGNKVEEGTPEEPQCSGNVSTLSITATRNMLFKMNAYNAEKMKSTNSCLDLISQLVLF